jgi:hypothetical protein
MCPNLKAVNLSCCNTVTDDQDISMPKDILVLFEKFLIREYGGDTARDLLQKVSLSDSPK